MHFVALSTKGNNMSVAIITGASGGIGSEFARQLNKMLGIDEFWFIARREDRMLRLRDAP